jgi:hypothetical protein
MYKRNVNRIQPMELLPGTVNTQFCVIVTSGDLTRLRGEFSTLSGLCVKVNKLCVCSVTDVCDRWKLAVRSVCEQTGVELLLLLLWHSSPPSFDDDDVMTSTDQSCGKPHRQVPDSREQNEVWAGLDRVGLRQVKGGYRLHPVAWRTATPSCCSEQTSALTLPLVWNSLFRIYWSRSVPGQERRKSCSPLSHMLKETESVSASWPS